jgi:hypothetical protein
MVLGQQQLGNAGLKYLNKLSIFSYLLFQYAITICYAPHLCFAKAEVQKQFK